LSSLFLRLFRMIGITRKGTRFCGNHRPGGARHMHWPHAFIHVDMDTFFVSVERLHDASLRGQPVIVGGGKDGDQRRGVVAACSYETRKFGVHSAMPLAQAIRLCPQAIVVPVGSSNYREYTARKCERCSRGSPIGLR
jgi:nucleotidyltransferase/DNA polymerase involved in DNA repair